MVLQGEQPAAPDLNLDAKTERGFVDFFRTLPEVGPRPRQAARGPAHVVLPRLAGSGLSTAVPQDPRLVRFFDRKVGSRPVTARPAVPHAHLDRSSCPLAAAAGGRVRHGSPSRAAPCHPLSERP